jgi:outer membrane lipoprotein-sorting protein
VILKYIATLALILLLSFFLFGDEIDELLTKWEERLKDEKLISCKMAQVKKISFLKDPVKISGTFYFKYPNLFRLEMRGDENYDLYCDGTVITIVNHDLDEKEVYDLKDLDPSQSGKKLLPPLINQTREDIKENYQISYSEADELYEVLPKSMADHPFKKLDFKIDAEKRIKWTKLIYHNEDWTETMFSKWKKHGDVSDYFFKYMKNIPEHFASGAI